MRNDLTSVSANAWRMAVRLAKIQDLPSNLELYAREVGLQQVIAKPLLSDAGLMRDGTIYCIVVNAEHPGVTWPIGHSAFTGDGSWQKFNNPLRFTVCHEIAHLLLIKAADNDNDALSDGSRSAIETACNVLARAMLIPRGKILEVQPASLFDLESLQSIIQDFRVSPEVFFRRLSLADVSGAFGKLNGLAGFLIETDAGLVIKGCHVFGAIAKERFDSALGKAKVRWRHDALSKEFKQIYWALDGRPFKDIKIKAAGALEDRMRREERGEEHLDVQWSQSDILPVGFAFHRLSTDPLRVLFRFAILGPIQKPGQGNLF